MPQTCLVCGRDPALVNGPTSECSHLSCPCRSALTADVPHHTHGGETAQAPLPSPELLDALEIA